MIELHVDAKAVNASLKRMEKDVKWATTDALNAMAKEIQDYQVKKNFPRAFTLRSKWYKPNNRLGVKVRRAGTNTLQSVVYSRAPWLALQEEGGVKRPEAGRKFFAIAVKARSNQARRIPRARYLDRLVQNRKAFFQGAQVMTATKTGRLRYEYALAKSARIAPRLRFGATSRALTNRKWDSIWRAAWEARMARQRGRGR